MKHDPRIARYQLTREQSVFASAWYNMTYAYSLDAHRVRVMHAVNVLEELSRISAYAHASADDRHMVAREAISILDTEAVLKRGGLQTATASLRALLESSYGAKPDKSAMEKNRALLDSHLRQYVALLHQVYVEEAFHGIHDAVLAPDGRAEPERFQEIRSLTGSLLSYLIAQGRSIDGLFQLYSHVLVPIYNPPARPYNFAAQFDSLRRITTSPSRTWRACFAIDGVTDSQTFPQLIGGIAFAMAPAPGVAGVRGMKPHGRRLFALGEADASDARTAGQLVHERINRVLDIVRFEYDRASIRVSDHFASQEAAEQANENWRALPIPRVIPNPQTSISREELDAFAHNVSLLVTSKRFSTEERDRVLAAFRLYRMGADTTNFENKLVNWWTALEFLAKSSGGSSSIASVVENSVTPILMGVSVINHLNAYREVLLEHSIELADAATGDPVALKQLNVAQLFELFSVPGHRQTINAALQDAPLTQMRFDQFMGLLAAPADLKAFLERSEQGLRWHLQRVWRARCDIVHSAGRMINIALLCANLEAYLKSVLTAVLAAFGRIPTLESPQELFIRTAHDYTTARETLARGNIEPLKAFLVSLK